MQTFARQTLQDGRCDDADINSVAMIGCSRQILNTIHTPTQPQDNIVGFSCTSGAVVELCMAP